MPLIALRSYSLLIIVFEGTTIDETWWSECRIWDDLSTSFCRMRKAGKSTTHEQSLEDTADRMIRFNLNSSFHHQHDLTDDAVRLI